MNVSQKPIIWTVVVASAILLLSQFYFVSQIPEPQAIPTPASAAEIANAVAPLIVIPEVTNPDVAKLDKLCELTDGCESYEITEDDATDAISEVTNEIPDSKDFERAFADLVDVDRDYLVFRRGYPDLLDSKVIAQTKDDKDDENFLVELFYKVKYKDKDDDDYSTIYVLVSSTLDEGDYDSLSIEEVDRNFEFE